MAKIEEQPSSLIIYADDSVVTAQSMDELHMAIIVLCCMFIQLNL